MKKHDSILLFLSFISNFLVSQTGTIKVAKPAPKKDSVITQKAYRRIRLEIGSNYTFKGINKLGVDAEVIFRLAHRTFIGLQYSYQNQYYSLSPFNTETLKQETISGKSENKQQYLKMPIGFSYYMNIGTQCTFNISPELAPEYLLSTSNQYGRLNYSKFHQYNVSGIISIGLRIRSRLSLNICYSKDFFENLKDRNMYNVTGTVVGKQKSKTNLISLSLSTYIGRY